MYADDLVLITQATRRVARNVNLCLSIYSFLTGQNPNLNKSSVYFPKWLNGKLGRGISKILGFSIGGIFSFYLPWYCHLSYQITCVSFLPYGFLFPKPNFILEKPSYLNCWQAHLDKRCPFKYPLLHIGCLSHSGHHS